MRRITKAAIWLGIGGALYLISCNHFIYFGGRTVKLLKKKQPTLSRTFFSTSLKTNDVILRDDVLREAGIADLLVEMHLMSEAEKKRLMAKYEKEE
ncbi:conserved hypothetical protein [uncultured Desulfobacterium sp.]|uniref:Uncharacterized protein n=1 Tax=uncultured Desulfobacterium sp. TaxID=201089 RepID=A0A445MQN3_9BACT|nr:conserved hypothetical protein [uncultured Desulfobacterium sp.]